MNKGRLEAFSDGVFAIVVTLLIFNVKDPVLAAPVSDPALWQALLDMLPTIGVYVVTFTIISVLWINHHFLFHTFAKTVNRQLNLLNLVYLMFVVLLPFSASFLGMYITHQPAAVVYGLNIFCISFMSMTMLRYIRRTPGIFNLDISRRGVKQARIRTGISEVCAVLGLLSTFLYVPLSIFFYAFPVIFNIIPGSLDLSERLFGFTID